MQTETIFDVAQFEALNLASLFFHSFDDDYSPAMRVTTLDGQPMVIDFNMAQLNGPPQPSLVSEADFLGSTFVSVANASVRLPTSLKNIVHGATGVGSPPIGSVILRSGGRVIRVRHQGSTGLSFNLDTGQQVKSQDSAHCAWSNQWEIVVRNQNMKEAVVLFSRK